MSPAAEKVFREALALSEEERAALRDALDRSLDSDFELTPAWREEIARRITAIERGEAEFVDAHEHLESLRKKFSAG